MSCVAHFGSKNKGLSAKGSAEGGVELLIMNVPVAMAFWGDSPQLSIAIGPIHRATKPTKYLQLILGNAHSKETPRLKAT